MDVAGQRIPRLPFIELGEAQFITGFVGSYEHVRTIEELGFRGHREYLAIHGPDGFEQAAFSLIGAFPFGVFVGGEAPAVSAAAGILWGVLDVQTGLGHGTCSSMDVGSTGLTCGTGTPVTYTTVVSCGAAEP